MIKTTTRGIIPLALSEATASNRMVAKLSLCEL